MGRGPQRSHEHRQDHCQHVRHQDGEFTGHPGHLRRHHLAQYERHHRHPGHHGEFTDNGRRRHSDLLHEGLRLHQRPRSGRGHLEPRRGTRGVLYQCQSDMGEPEAHLYDGRTNKGRRRRDDLRQEEPLRWTAYLYRRYQQPRQIQQRTVCRLHLLLRPPEHQVETQRQGVLL